MSEYDARLRDALELMAPPLEGEAGDWERVLRDAGFTGRRVRPRRLLVALAVVVTGAGLLALPSFGIGRDLFALRFLIPGEPPLVKGPVDVATGTFHGVPWRLTAYTSDHGRVCVDLRLPKSNSGGCGGGEGWIGPVSIGWDNQVPSSLLVHGGVAAGVARVEVVIADGSRFSFQTFESPEGLGVKLRFFAGELARDAVVTAIVVKGADGVTLETRAVKATDRPAG